VDAQLYICSAAEVDPAGRVHALGVGTDVLPEEHGPITVVARIVLDEEDAVRPHRTRLRLLDRHGSPVLTQGGPSPDGPGILPPTPQPIELPGEVPPVVPSADALPPWGWVSAPLVYMIGPGTLPGPGLFHWEFAVDGEVLDSAPIFVLSAAQMQQMQGQQ